MTAVNNFIQNYLSNLYIPRITWTDIIEIFIIAFVLYSFLVWIKNTKAWALLKGTFGAIEAIEEAGKTCGPEGEIVIISFDAASAALEAMKNGKINVDFECNPELGPMVSEVIQKLEQGEAVEKYQYVEETYFDPTMDLETLIPKRTY